MDLVAVGLRGLRALAARMAALRVIRSGRHAAAWREAARAAGLGAVEESGGALGGLGGAPARAPAALRRFRLPRHADHRLGARDARGPHRAAGGGRHRDPDGVRGVREVEIGHDTFDAAAWVEGSPALARAVLDAGTRRALRGLFEGRLERPGRSPVLRPGASRTASSGSTCPRPPRATRDPAGAASPARSSAAYATTWAAWSTWARCCRTVLALARRLATPADVPRRLADNLKSEPVAGVRLQLLATLAREFPDDPATREALVAAREDPDAEVRLRAGIALGPEGRDVLLAIAGGEGAPDETTERAVVALGFFLTADAAQGILRNALRTRREATARACLGALGRRRGAGVVPTLAKVLAVEKPELAAVAADALGATGDASAERALLAALGSPHAPVRVAAARALGRVGTTAAVLPLKGLEARDGAGPRGGPAGDRPHPVARGRGGARSAVPRGRRVRPAVAGLGGAGRLSLAVILRALPCRRPKDPQPRRILRDRADGSRSG